MHASVTKIQMINFSKNNSKMVALMDLFVLGNPIEGPPPKKKEGIREKERSVCSPPSRGILSGPGGEPDGAEQGRGVQGVGGVY